MNIVVIGSSQYRDKILAHARKLKEEDPTLTVHTPAFDEHPGLDDLGCCMYNRKLIEEADKVHLLWDQRSTGTIFDFGMLFALRKPLKIIYMEEKTFKGVMEKYEKKMSEG